MVAHNLMFGIDVIMNRVHESKCAMGNLRETWKKHLGQSPHFSIYSTKSTVISGLSVTAYMMFLERTKVAVAYRAVWILCDF